MPIKFLVLNKRKMETFLCFIVFITATMISTSQAATVTNVDNPGEPISGGDAVSFDNTLDAEDLAPDSVGAAELDEDEGYTFRELTVTGDDTTDNEIVVTEESVVIDAEDVEVTGANTNLNSDTTNVNSEDINIGDAAGTSGTTNINSEAINIGDGTDGTTTVRGATANLNSGTTNIDSSVATNINSETINIGDGDDGTTTVRGASANLNSGTTTITTGNTQAVYNSEGVTTRVGGTAQGETRSVISQSDTETSVLLFREGAESVGGGGATGASTHGEGNMIRAKSDGLTVKATETTLSGGTGVDSSTTLTLNDEGLKLSGPNGEPRRLGGIADGVAPTDAVNVRQLNSAIEKVSKGVALSMAMGSIPQAFNGESSVGVGFGHFDGKSAAAVGISHNDAENNMTYNFKVSNSFGGGDSEVGFSAGAGWSF
ncbi:MAG: hypothetical protein HFP78_02935 [Methylococcales symbiont of Hymedesmia sp. n. MRB-2018]|nr:MAG: hypothetical protein HFP78_02935 [Methylococcales symbiont of Hymedesmia sp. n. MRB-2018]